MTNIYFNKARKVLTVNLTDGPLTAVVKGVFVAKWTASLPLDRIVKLAGALYYFEPEEAEVETTLNMLVKAKVLLTRTYKGVRLWEVNF